MKEQDVKRAVRESYGKIAEQGAPCDNAMNAPCCGGAMPGDVSKLIGYTDQDIKSAPEGANLGLGCGNPVAMASLKEGETVLDLGSGAGFDCFLAAERVGKSGHVIGVDMTPQMLDRARENARKGNDGNVEFRLGEIENLPVADAAVDVIISNCVINLAADKKRVFKEAFRVLRPGGRLMISDMVLLKELPEAVRNSVEAYVGCVAGAIQKEQYLEAVKGAGFAEVGISDETHFPIELMLGDPLAQSVVAQTGIPISGLKELADSVVSIKVHAVKPQNQRRKSKA